MPVLPRGLYEVLITAAIEARLSEPGDRFEVRRGDLREADAADRIAFHLAQVVERAVSSFDRKERVEKGIALARKLIEDIRAVTEGAASEEPVAPGAVLRAIASRLPDGDPETISEPLVPLLDTTLLTNAPGEPRVGNQIGTEIHSADRISQLFPTKRAKFVAPPRMLLG